MSIRFVTHFLILSSASSASADIFFRSIMRSTVWRIPVRRMDFPWIRYVRCLNSIFPIPSLTRTNWTHCCFRLLLCWSSCIGRNALDFPIQQDGWRNRISCLDGFFFSLRRIWTGHSRLRSYAAHSTAAVLTSATCFAPQPGTASRNIWICCGWKKPESCSRKPIFR